MIRTDTRGQYQFSGLAPGEYRLLATFEYQAPTAAEFDLAHAVTNGVLAAWVFASGEWQYWL